MDFRSFWNLPKNQIYDTDARQDDGLMIQEFGGRASSGSGGIAGTETHDDAAEDVGEGKMGNASIRISNSGNLPSTADKPSNWGTMTKGQRKSWYKTKRKRQRSENQ